MRWANGTSRRWPDRAHVLLVITSWPARRGARSSIGGTAANPPREAKARPRFEAAHQLVLTSMDPLGHQNGRSGSEHQ